MHPRVIADAVATALRTLDLPPVAIEAESGGGRIGLWLTVDHPELVERLVLAAVASETPPDSPMAERMARWIELGEAGDWGTFFASMAQLMKAAHRGGVRVIRRRRAPSAAAGDARAVHR